MTIYVFLLCQRMRAPLTFVRNYAKTLVLPLQRFTLEVLSVLLWTLKLKPNGI